MTHCFCKSDWDVRCVCTPDKFSWWNCPMKLYYTNFTIFNDYFNCKEFDKLRIIRYTKDNIKNLVNELYIQEEYKLNNDEINTLCGIIDDEHVNNIDEQ